MTRPSALLAAAIALVAALACGCANDRQSAANAAGEAEPGSVQPPAQEQPARKPAPEVKPAIRDPEPPRGVEDRVPEKPKVKTIERFAWADGTPLRSRTLPGGLAVQDFALGDGPEVTLGATVNVEFIARTPDGYICDTTAVRPQGPVLAVYGANYRGAPADLIIDRLPPGWRDGLVGMQAGGKRRLVIPYALLYGEAGRPPRIPPATDITYDIELNWFSLPVEKKP